MRYVEAAYHRRHLGPAHPVRHVIPNAIAPVLAQLSVNIGWAILLTAALSFIGAGVEAPTPEWGSMIAMGFQNIIDRPLVAVDFPRPRPGGHRLRLRADRLERRGAGRPGAPARPCRQLERAATGRIRPEQAQAEPSHALLAYIGRRLLFVGPQLARHPAGQLPAGEAHSGRSRGADAGPVRDPGRARRLRAELGLDQPLFEQFLIYLWHVLQGDLGTSWQTTLPVTTDLAQRFPATLELVTLRPAAGAAASAFRSASRARATSAAACCASIADYYGLLAGALPDFWLGPGADLRLLHHARHGAPAPLGRLDYRDPAAGRRHRLSA